MELLKLVNQIQSDEYEHKLRRESYRNYCGMHLNEFQIDVLIADCVNNSQTIYRAQPRQGGTSTAVLLKAYQSIFDYSNYNNKHIICRNNNMASIMKDRMIALIGQAGMLEHVVRSTRHMIELDFGTRIRFENSNPLNLTGIATGPEFFFDDYNINNNATNEEFNSHMRITFPTHIHYFLEGIESLNFYPDNYM